MYVATYLSSNIHTCIDVRMINILIAKSPLLYIVHACTQIVFQHIAIAANHTSSVSVLLLIKLKFFIFPVGNENFLIFFKKVATSCSLTGIYKYTPMLDSHHSSLDYAISFAIYALEILFIASYILWLATRTA